MAMTTADARLTYDYALRDAVLERIRRLEDLGWRVRMRFVGENRPVSIWKALDRPGTVDIELSRYTDVGVMEQAYRWLIEILASLTENTSATGEWHAARDDRWKPSLLHETRAGGGTCNPR